MVSGWQKGRSVEPLFGRRIADALQFAGHDVRAQGPAHAAFDIERPSQDSNRIRQPTGYRKISAVLPARENVRHKSFLQKSPVLSERQIVSPSAQ